MIREVNAYLVGWHGYFRWVWRSGWSDMRALDGFVRRRIRSAISGRYAKGRWQSAILPNSLLAELGLKPPSGVVLDGFNMMPTLTGVAPSPRKQMFWQRRDDRAARVGHWKWVESARGNGLFDLSKDVGETKDLSGENPGKRKELKAAFARWEAEMKAAEPRGPFRDY